MIYFDNAATSFPKPPQVGAEMLRFLAEDAANPGRAGHRMAVRAEHLQDAARLELTRLFNGEDAQRMIFALNCTDALNMALKGVLVRNGGEHVVTTVLEHNSVSRPLEAMVRSGEIELTRVPCDGEGFVDPDDVRRALRPSTRMIVMTHASNVLGTIQDVAAVGAIARERDLLFCVDAAQTAGIVPIDIEAMHIDLLACPGHKSLLGPPGTGALYVGARCPAPAETGTRGAAPSHAAAPSHGGTSSHAAAPQMPASARDETAPLRPWREGGTGGDSATPTQPALFPYFLEGGTPNTVGIAGLRAGVRYLAERGVGELLEHERRLVRAVLDGLGGDPRFSIYGPRGVERRVGPLSVNIAGYDPSDAAAVLDDSFDIAVRPGLHCAPYCHRSLGTFPAGTLRISPGPFNTDADVAALLRALDQVAG